MKQLPYYCRYFNGVIGHRTCLAGVAYREIAVLIPSPSDGRPRRQYPCLAPRFDHCPKRAYYTDEERAQATDTKNAKGDFWL